MYKENIFPFYSSMNSQQKLVVKAEVELQNISIHMKQKNTYRSHLLIE